MDNVASPGRQRTSIKFYAVRQWHELDDALGEYDRPGDESYLQARARSHFFRLMWGEASPVIAALQRGPLACYREADRALGDWKRLVEDALRSWANDEYWTLDDWQSEELWKHMERQHELEQCLMRPLLTWGNLHQAVTGILEPPQEFVELWREVESWAWCYGLTADWCLRRAFGMLPLWYEQESDSEWEGLEDEEIWSFLGEEYPRPSDCDEVVVVSFTPWQPFKERRATATHRIQAELRRQVQAYLDQTEHAMRMAGARRTSRESRHHLEWLVRYQVRRESSVRIAKEVGVDRKTVEAGVRKAAALIGLRLRPPRKGGRPRKKAA